MQKRNVWLFPAAAICAFLLCSCSDYVGKEKSHPLFVKAGTSKSAGNFQDAARCYEEFLLICPRSTAACKELADLYNDSLQDPLKAVYYYERWLSMLPPDASGSTEIRAFAENARKNLYKKLSAFYKDDPALNQNPEELRRMNARLAAYAEHTRKLTERNQQLVAIIEKLNAERRRINAQNQGTAASGPIRAAENRNRTRSALSGTETRTATTVRTKAAPQSTAKPVVRGGTVYTVQRGDTLSRISRRFYGTSSKVNLIVSANPGKIGRNMSIRIGQKLQIPSQSGNRR